MKHMIRICETEDDPLFGRQQWKVACRTCEAMLSEHTPHVRVTIEQHLAGEECDYQRPLTLDEILSLGRAPWKLGPGRPRSRTEVEHATGDWLASTGPQGDQQARE